MRGLEGTDSSVLSRGFVRRVFRLRGCFSCRESKAMATEEEFKPLGKGFSSSLHSSAGVRRQDPPSNALVYLAPEYW